jgi:hypothetical protein
VTDQDAIEILARWVNELQGDLACNEGRHVVRITALEAEIAELKATIRGYAYWMRTGLTPDEIHEAARELDPVVVGA